MMRGVITAFYRVFTSMLATKPMYHRKSCVGEGMLNDHRRIGCFIDVGVKECSSHRLDTVQIGFFPIYHILSHIPPMDIPGSSI